MSKQNNGMLPPPWVARLYFFSAFVWMILFTLTIPWVQPIYLKSASNFSHPRIVGWLHLLTIGVLTQIIFAAWSHIRIMLAGLPSPSPRRLVVRWLALNLGLAGFSVSMAGGWYTWGLTLFGTLLGGVFLDIGALNTVALWNSQQTGKYRPFLVFAFLSLAVMGLLGFLMAHNKSVPLLPASHSPLDWIHTHAVIGLGGWFGMMAVGISYRLIPMFLRVDEEPIRYSAPVQYLLMGGIIAWVIGIWSGWDLWLTVGKLGVFLAMGTWFGQLSRQWFQRETRGWPPAFSWLAAGVVYGISGLILAFPNRPIQAMVPAGVFILISIFCFELGVLHRILPLIKKIGDNPLLIRSPQNKKNINQPRPLIVIKRTGFILTQAGFLALLARPVSIGFWGVGLLGLGLIITTLHLGFVLEASPDEWLDTTG